MGIGILIEYLNIFFSIQRKQYILNNDQTHKNEEYKNFHISIWKVPFYEIERGKTISFREKNKVTVLKENLKILDAIGADSWVPRVS